MLLQNHYIEDACLGKIFVMNKKLIVAALILLGSLVIIFSSFQAQAYVSIQTQNGEVVFTVEVMRTSSEQAQGLMYRDGIADNIGMLFVYSDSAERIFWMKNTYFPLDMLFLDTQGKVIHLIHEAQPCSIDNCSNFSSVYPAQYVLEIRGGLVREKQIQLGDRVEMFL